MNWTMPYPWRSRSDSVRRINMSSEPGNESFFCALRPIPRILSLQRRDYASQVQIVKPRPRDDSVCSRALDANRYGASCRCQQRGFVRSQRRRKASERSVRVVGKQEVIQLSESADSDLAPPAVSNPDVFER